MRRIGNPRNSQMQTTLGAGPERQTYRNAVAQQNQRGGRRYNISEDETAEGTERALSKAQKIKSDQRIMRLKDNDYIEIDPEKVDIIGQSYKN